MKVRDKLISDAEDIYKQQPDPDLKNILEKANKIKEEKDIREMDKLIILCTKK